MATAAQVLANRENAQHSTGPRTEEGKLASSTNATKTGLTSPNIFVRPEEEPVFADFQERFVQELQPNGINQITLFEIILHAAWNIRRCIQLESEALEAAFHQGLDEDDEALNKKIDRIYRYKKMHESSKRRATAELRQLQTEQIWRRESGELQTESILADTSNVVTKISSVNSVQQRANLDVIRQHIEATVCGGKVEYAPRQ